MYVCATCVCLAPGRPEKDKRSPGVPGGCEHPRGSWEANSGPEQQAPLASEPSLQPTTRHPCMNLELIVKAVVPSDHCDSYRN